MTHELYKHTVRVGKEQRNHKSFIERGVGLGGGSLGQRTDEPMQKHRSMRLYGVGEKYSVDSLR